MPDGVERGGEFGEDLSIPETKDLEALGAQPCVPLSVVSRLLRMLVAIEFDDDLMAIAGEIHHERPYRRLAPKFKPHEPPGAQLCPKLALSIGG